MIEKNDNQSGNGHKERRLKNVRLLTGTASALTGEAQAEQIRTVISLREEQLQDEAASESETLFLTDDPKLLKELLGKGMAAAAYHPKGTVMRDFPGASYIIEEPDQLEGDSWHKIFQRLCGLPWTILETERCILREMISEDLEQLTELFDEEALRFLEGPGEDPVLERELHNEYIRRVYPFYGFGMWAVLDRQSGRLIGKAGLEQNQRGTFLGYLIHPAFRRQGIAAEVCGAILSYARTELGLESLWAETAPDNEGSLKLLLDLGFNRIAERSEDGHLLLKKGL